MLFIIIGLVISVIAFVAIVLANRLTETTLASVKKWIVLAMVGVLIVSTGVFVSSVQLAHLESNYYKVSGIITFDEEDYPHANFVDLYENVNTKKLYKVENVAGFIIYNEVEAVEDSTIIPVINCDEAPYFEGEPVYTEK